MKEIDYRDIAALNEQITDNFGPASSEMVISQSLINQFSDLSGDHQWIHTDPARAARESPFGTTIAHGFLLLAIMPKVRPPQAFTVTGHSSVLNYGSSGFKFLDPVTSGSMLSSRQRLKAVDERKGGTLLTFELEFNVTNATRPSLVYNMTLFYR